MTDYPACSYPSHRAHDWRFSPDVQPTCGVCHPPADPSTVEWVAPKPGAVLAELEVVIETGREAFIAVCQALGRIRDERLYRESYTTFEDYCQGRWGWTRQHVNRQIEAARKVEILEPVGSIPERVLRELPPADEPDAMREAWAESIERNGERPTAEQVAATVNDLRAEYAARAAGGAAGDGYRPEPEPSGGMRPIGPKATASPGAFPTVLVVVVLERGIPRVLAWQPLSVAADDLADLDLEHARRHIAKREAELRETAEWVVDLCSCDRPMPNGEGGCVHCAKGLRSLSEPVRLHPAEVDAIARRLLELLREEGAIGAARTAAPELLTAAEVARRFGVDRSWVYAHADELGAARLGGGAKPRLRFDPERVARALRVHPLRGNAGRPPHPVVDVSELASDPLSVLPDRWRAAVDCA